MKIKRRNKYEFFTRIFTHNNLDKVEKVVDNVNDKVRALDGLFHIIDTTTDRVVLITDKVIEGITSLIANLFITKKSKAPKKDEQNKEKKNGSKED